MNRNLFDLTGKVALVTGASSGLGVQFAKALASAGASVAICARRVEKLASVKAELDAMGATCFAVKCDVTNVAEIKAAIATIKAHFGRIDILVNNAGLGLTEPAESQSDETWLKMINTNLNGVYFMAREVGKIMLEQNYGKIINIGSIHSLVAFPGSPLTAYNATKGGVAMLTKSLANEWSKRGITVNAIGPGYFPSEMTQGVVENAQAKSAVEALTPMGRLGRNGELDGALLYFASDASSYCTGQLLCVDGGFTAV